MLSHMYSPKKAKNRVGPPPARSEQSDDDMVYPPTAYANIGTSPWFIGKAKRKEGPLRLLNKKMPGNRDDQNEIVIDDDDSIEIEESVSPMEPRRKDMVISEEGPSSSCENGATNGILNSTIPIPNRISSKGKSPFDFSGDPKVARIRNKINRLIDPKGERQHNCDFQFQVNTMASKGIDAFNQPAKKRQKAVERRNPAPFEDFKMASGGSIVKEVRGVLPHREDTEESLPRPLGPRKASSFTVPIKKAMEMATIGGTKDEPVSGLRAEPSLKHFDEHIISLIESEIMSLSTEIGWKDVAGLEGAKKALREIVVLPFKRPDVFKGIRAPPKGVLLFGPPGTGKTMIGRCVASQCRATFFNISASSLTSKWVGEGEKLVRALFAVARVKLPSVIFIDEIDSILTARSETEHESSRRIKTEFLVQLDGVATAAEERLLVLGATNRPQELDEAARRRFAKRLYIALPEPEARLVIVKNLLDGMSHDVDHEALKRISNLTEGYSGADMRQLCAEAAMGPIRDVGDDIETIHEDEIRPINVKDFVDAARVVRPTVVDEDLVAYEKWDKKFGCLVQPL